MGRLPGLRRIALRRLFAPIAPAGPWPGFGGAPTSVDIGDAASAGVSGLGAQSDHEHAVPAPLLAPPAVAAASALGVLTTPARSDHTHAIGAYAFPGFGPAPAAVDIGDTGNAGAAATASRSDHEHAVPASVVAPTSVDIGDTGTVGTATTPSRSDHEHAFPASAVTPLAVAAAGAVGVASTPARSDHAHAHGNQAGGALHAVAVAGGDAGFLSGADKSKLDALPVTTSWGLTPEGPAFGAANIPAYVKDDGSNFSDGVLSFATGDKCTWKFPILLYLAGQNFTVDVFWRATATTNAAVWGARIAAMTSGDAQSVLTKAFGTQATQSTTVNATASGLNKTTITVSSLDSAAQGDLAWLEIERLAAGNTLAVAPSLELVVISYPRS